MQSPFCGCESYSSTTSLLSMNTSPSAMSWSKPNVPARSYVRTGIGGAGNYHKNTSYKSAPHSAGVDPPRYPTGRSRAPLTHTGIGGAGNIKNPRYSRHNPSPLSEAEVDGLEREQVVLKDGPPVLFRGIGGAGNRVHKDALHGSMSDRSTRSSRTDSQRSLEVAPEEEGSLNDDDDPVTGVDKLRSAMVRAYGRLSLSRRKASQAEGPGMGEKERIPEASEGAEQEKR